MTYHSFNQRRAETLLVHHLDTSCSTLVLRVLVEWIEVAEQRSQISTLGVRAAVPDTLVEVGVAPPNACPPPLRVLPERWCRRIRAGPGHLPAQEARRAREWRAFQNGVDVADSASDGVGTQRYRDSVENLDFQIHVVAPAHVEAGSPVRPVPSSTPSAANMRGR